MLGFEHFTGEFGGLLAVSWGIGAVSGWGFAQKTAVAAAQSRMDELRAELTDARDRIKALEDERYSHARQDIGSLRNEIQIDRAKQSLGKANE